MTGPRDPDDIGEQELQEQIRRFPEKFPVSLGGLMPDALHKEYADRAMADRDYADEAFGGEDYNDYDE